MADNILRVEVKEGNKVTDYLEYQFKNGKLKNSKGFILDQIEGLIDEVTNE